MNDPIYWTSKDYITLFEIILGTPIGKEIVFVTQKSYWGKTVSKLVNKNTRECCKVLPYLTLIKQRLGENCFEQNTPQQICEKLSKETKESIYTQLIHTRVVGHNMSSAIRHES